MVKKLTVEIPDELNEMLNTIARTKGITKGELVLKALQAYVEGSTVDEETLENVNARCIWEALKILRAMQKMQLELEEARLAMEMRMKRKYLLGELAHATQLAKSLAKFAERLKIEKGEKLTKEEKRRLEELFETFLYGMGARLGLLPEEWVSVEESSGGSSKESQGEKGSTGEEEEEGEEEEANVES